MKFRKKPVTVDAWPFDGSFESYTHIKGQNPSLVARWFNAGISGRPACTEIQTLEGTMTAMPGDYIIKGVKGEFYPCKPDIFAATYEPAAAPSLPPEGWQGNGVTSVMSTAPMTRASGDFTSLTVSLIPTGWRPIETYDHAKFTGDPDAIGKGVLIAAGDLVGEAYFNPQSGGGTWWWSGTLDGEYADSAIYTPVTHWMPLPAAPSSAPSPAKETP